MDGRFHFDVEIAAPIIGLIVGYRGTLKPADQMSPQGEAAAGDA